MQKKICFVSLGCDKNRVDLEVMINAFLRNGYIMSSEEEAEVAIINTCAFLTESRKEAIQNILQMANYKNNKLQKLVVSGCLPNFENIEELKKLLPEVDLFVKIEEQPNIVNLVNSLFDNNSKPAIGYSLTDRKITTLGSTSYLKICEGCSNGCSYCTIPKIRGKFKSRKIEDLLVEAKKLIDNGIQELIIVGQDITKYGIDIYGEPKLCDLIEKLSELDLKWIRLLYCYPDGIDDRLIDIIAKNKKVCKYIDIPLQHISDKILTSMRRKTSKEQIISIINKIRNANSHIAIRTTFIVGYPGETRKDFKELCDFIKAYKLNNVGVFEYSREDGTIASRLAHQVPKFIKAYRRKKLYRLQQNVLLLHQISAINKIYDCVCDNKLSNNVYLFRNQFNAPDIDYFITVETDEDLTIGEFYKVKVVDYFKDYLIGEIQYESTK